MKKKINNTPSPRYESECMNWTCGEVSLKYEVKNRPSVVIWNSDDTYKFFEQNIGIDSIQVQEHFFAIYLDYARNVVGYRTISKGDTISVIVDVKQILCVGLILNAHFIIIAHNHPSNQLFPSNADIEITEKLIDAAYVVGLSLLDHVILGSYGYFSMLEKGTLSFARPTKTKQIKERA